MVRRKYGGEGQRRLLLDERDDVLGVGDEERRVLARIRMVSVGGTLQGRKTDARHTIRRQASAPTMSVEMELSPFSDEICRADEVSEGQPRLLSDETEERTL
jgi:hypothetical protein